MTESALYPQIMQAFSRGNTRIFRQNAGTAWQGKIIEQTPSRLVLAYPRAIRLGSPGQSDLGGITSVVITPEMVGQLIGVDVQIECKFGTGPATAEQNAYIQTIRALGGRAGIARSVEDAARIIAGFTPP
jgi:hypothetical protein